MTKKTIEYIPETTFIIYLACAAVFCVVFILIGLHITMPKEMELLERVSQCERNVDRLLNNPL